MISALGIAVTLLAHTLQATHAAPEASRKVGVVAPAIQDPIVREAATRVRGELVAAGFEIVALAAREGLSAREGVEAPQDDVLLAVFAIAPTSAGAEVWVSDRVHHRTVVQSFATDRGPRERSVAVLAFSAVELLRASLAEAWLPAKPTAPAPPAPSTPVVATVATPEPRPPRATAGGFVEAFALARADALLWGGGLRATGAVHGPVDVVLELAAAAGRRDSAFAATHVLLATSALGLRASFGASALRAALEVGVRGGALKLASMLPSASAYAAESGVGPWGGPTLSAALGLGTRRFRVELAATAGYAFVSSRGTFPDGQSTPLDSRGPWLGLRVGVGAGL